MLNNLNESKQLGDNQVLYVIQAKNPYLKIINKIANIHSFIIATNDDLYFDRSRK